MQEIVWYVEKEDYRSSTWGWEHGKL